jgi:hypothetical protein
MPKFVYLLRARESATAAALQNGVSPLRLRVSFPDLLSFAPVRVRAVVIANLHLARSRPHPVEASAVAEAASPPSALGGMPAIASGGGYSGPLVYRNGEPSP